MFDKCKMIEKIKTIHHLISAWQSELHRSVISLFSMGKNIENFFKKYVRWEEKICYYKQRG